MTYDCRIPRIIKSVFHFPENVADDARIKFIVGITMHQSTIKKTMTMLNGQEDHKTCYFILIGVSFDFVMKEKFLF